MEGVGGEWSGEDGDEEEDGGEGGVEEEEENAGYYYQPLNQDPEGPNGLEAGDPHAEQILEVQDRIEVRAPVRPVIPEKHCHLIVGTHPHFNPVRGGDAFQ